MSLTRCHGEGILGVELCCEECNEYIDLSYIYMEHAWRGTCWACMLAYVVDLENIIGEAKHGPYIDWDFELNNLMAEI